MTNAQRILSNITIDDLAEMCLRHRSETEVDYDSDNEPYVADVIDVWSTDDGEEFHSLDEAVKHEKWWLSKDPEEISEKEAMQILENIATDLTGLYASLGSDDPRKVVIGRKIIAIDMAQAALETVVTGELSSL